jgi:hypothetical protein
MPPLPVAKAACILFSQHGFCYYILWVSVGPMHHGFCCAWSPDRVVVKNPKFCLVIAVSRIYCRWSRDHAVEGLLAVYYTTVYGYAVSKSVAPAHWLSAHTPLAGTSIQCACLVVPTRPTGQRPMRTLAPAADFGGLALAWLRIAAARISLWCGFVWVAGRAALRQPVCLDIVSASVLALALVWPVRRC